MSRLRLWLTTLAMAVGVLAMTASPASAHYSSYGNHGCSGWSWRTCWLRSWDGCAYEITFNGTWQVACGHWHEYEHRSASFNQTHWCWVHVHAGNVQKPHSAGNSPAQCFG